MADPEPPFVTVLQDCSVLYEGRARAEQEGGTLVVVVKRDHAIVAHDLDSGTQPQFYNPGGSTTSERSDGRLLIEGESRDGETLRISGEPEHTYEIERFEARDRPDRKQLRGLERDLVERIREEPSILGLEGAEFRDEVHRVGGRFDLLYGEHTVVEVKRRATVKDFDQILRYLRDPDIEEAVLACLHASDNLEELCRDEARVDLAVLDEDRFKDWERAPDASSA